MNLKTTITLLILAGGAGALAWWGPDLAPKVGMAPEPTPAAKGSSATALGTINPGDISSVTVNVPGTAPVYFGAAAPGKPLELPGNWPVRRNEVEELVAMLSGLKSRFQPVPLDAGGDLKPYGLAPSQEPVVVDVATKEGAVKLTFGEEPKQSGENPFTRPAFVRVNSEPEVLRLGPDVLPVLRRSAEFYRKRQLFPDATRVRVADNSRSTQEAIPQFVVGDAVTSITVEGPNGRYVLRRTGESPKPKPPADKPGGEAVVLAGRLADVWEIVEPVRDRADPVKLKNVLTAIPDLWVEQFVPNPDAVTALGSIVPGGGGLTAAADLARGAAGAAALGTDQDHGPFLDRAGLKEKPNKIILTLADGSTRTVSIGKTSRTDRRTEAAPPPQFPGAPPQPPKVIEEKYYYAKLADNPLVFEIKGDKLNDLFLENAPPPPPMDPLAKMDLPATGPAVEQLRDHNPVRFETDQVVGITITRPGQTLELKKTKGDPKAESEAAKKDRWDLVQPFAGLAEGRQVSDLLDPLERLSAKKGEIIDRPQLDTILGGFAAADLAMMGLTPDQATTVTIVSDPATGVPPRTIRIGRRDPGTKKMFVLGPGENRINVVEDNAYEVVARQPRAYRALKLFDLGDDRVDSIAVQNEKEKFGLQENVGTTATSFVLTEPVKADADTEKARNLLKDLGSLEAAEYVYDPPTPSEAAVIRAFLGGLPFDPLALAGSHGFDKPTATAMIHFAGPKRLPPRTLVVGKKREGKEEYFAKLDGSPSVFAIKKEVAESLSGGSLALLPLQLWNGSPDGLTKVEVTRGTETPYTLTQAGGTWKVTAPFEAAADHGAVLPLAGALSAVRVEKYAAHKAANPAEYGFDKPSERIKFKLTERKVNKPGEEPKEESKERTLIVGKEGPDGKGRYARLEGDANPAVFVLADATAKDLDKPALDLLNKTLLTLAGSTVTKLELTGPDGPLTLQKEGNDWKPVGATFPVDRPTVDSLLRILGNLTALKFADYGDKVDWAKYGLDPNAKPQTVTVTAGTETHKLELGKPVEGTPNDRYARIDGGKAVVVLPITVARDLSKGKLDLVERTIFKFDPIDLQAIRRTMNGQEFEASLAGTSWEVTKPTKIPADQQGMEELGDRLGNLRAERVADVEGKDLAKYGLDKPTAVVKLDVIGKGAKTVEKSLKIGGPADPMKPEGDRYAQAEGATTVVVLSGNVAKRLLAEPIKFRDRNLASFVTADKAVVTRNGKDVTFTKAAGIWKMEHPVAADAEDEALRELHDMLARLRAEEIVADKPADLKQYGLDKPERWRLYSGDKEVLNLLVGAREKIGEPGKQKDGFRAYAKLDKGNLVVLLDMSLTAKLSAAYRKRALWEPLDVAQATTIEIDTPDGPGSFKLTKGPLGWMDVANPAERISTEAVTDFLDAFAGLKAERYVEHNTTDAGKIYGLDPARRTVTVTTQNGQKRTLLLGRTDDQKRVYAKPEGKDVKVVVLLSEADTGRINKERSGFLIGAHTEPELKVHSPKKEPAPKKGQQP